LAKRASGSRRRPASGERRVGPAQVVGRALEEQFKGIECLPVMLDAAVAVALFERGECPFDGRETALDQWIAALLPVGQAGLALVPPVHDLVVVPSRG